ncbi:hypothetical protein EDD16DRAFT_1526076 [Pisolithus croceorrhizus]|nr:hypothetical protein EDD16DRAFT_1526076 [Pisolithus croceorrhizus]
MSWVAMDNEHAIAAMENTRQLFTNSDRAPSTHLLQEGCPILQDYFIVKPPCLPWALLRAVVLHRSPYLFGVTSCGLNHLDFLPLSFSTFEVVPSVHNQGQLNSQVTLVCFSGLSSDGSCGLNKYDYKVKVWKVKDGLPLCSKFRQTASDILRQHFSSRLYVGAPWKIFSDHPTSISASALYIPSPLTAFSWLATPTQELQEGCNKDGRGRSCTAGLLVADGELQECYVECNHNSYGKNSPPHKEMLVVTQQKPVNRSSRCSQNTTTMTQTTLSMFSLAQYLMNLQ